MKKLGKKGSAFVWLSITILIFIIGIVYMIFTQPIREIQSATNETLNDPDYAQTYNTVILVWKYWPIVLIIGLIIVGVVLSIRKEPYSDFKI